MEANFVEAMKSIIIPSYDTCLDFSPFLKLHTYIYNCQWIRFHHQA